MDTYHKKVAAACVVIVLTLMLGVHFWNTESFASRRDKAAAVVSWFDRTAHPTYVGYRQALGGASDIVEYSDVMKLFRGRDLTVSNVERVL